MSIEFRHNRIRDPQPVHRPATPLSDEETRDLADLEADDRLLDDLEYAELGGEA